MADKRETEIVVKVDAKNAGKSLNDLEKEWKANEKAAKGAAIGTKEYEDAQKKAGASKNAYEGAKKDATELRKENGNLVESLGKFTPANGIIGDLGNKFREAKGAIGTAVQSMGALKAGIAATGIGLLVLGLTAAFAWIQKTDSGAKFLEGTLNAIGNVVDNLAGRLLKLVQGDFQGAFSNLASDLVDSAKAGYDLADAMDQIDENTRTVNLANSENEKLITRLLLQSKNRTISEQERIDLLDKASKLETENLQRSLDLQNQIIEAGEKKINQALKKNPDANIDDLRNKQVDLIVERNKLEQDSLNLQEKIENRRDALLQAEIAKQQKAADERKKIKDKELAETQAADKNIRDLRTQSIEDDYIREKEQLTNQFNDKIAALKGNEEQIAEQKRLLLEQFRADEKALEAELFQQDLDEALANIDIEEETKILQKQLWFSQNETDERTAQAALTEIHKQALEARLALLKGNDEKTKSERQKTQNELVKLEIDANKKSTADKKKTVDDQNRLDEARLSAASNAIGNLNALLVASAGEGVKATVAYKALAIAQATINTYQAATAAYASLAGIPIVGPVLGGVAAGVAVAAGLLNVQKIIAVQPGGKSAKYGAIIQGSPHGANYGEGGIALIDRVSGKEVGEMEGNEPILTAGVTRNPTLLAAASRINVAGGGKPLFADGGIPSSSVTPPQRGGDGGGVFQDYTPFFQTLIEETRANTQAIETMKTNLKAEVFVNEYEGKKRESNITKNNSSL